MSVLNSNHFFSNEVKIRAQNEKVVQLKICEIIYERNFENNFIVFLNDVLYFFIVSIFIIFKIYFEV